MPTIQSEDEYKRVSALLGAGRISNPQAAANAQRALDAWDAARPTNKPSPEQIVQPGVGTGEPQATEEASKDGLVNEDGSWYNQITWDAWRGFVGDTLRSFGDGEEGLYDTEVGAALMGMGRTVDDYATGLQQIWHRVNGEEDLARALEADQGKKNSIYEAYKEKDFVMDDVGEIIPDLLLFALPGGATIRGGAALGAISSFTKAVDEEESRVMNAGAGLAGGALGGAVGRAGGAFLRGFSGQTQVLSDSVEQYIKRGDVLSANAMKDMAVSGLGWLNKLGGKSEQGRVFLGAFRNLWKKGVTAPTEMLKHVRSQQTRNWQVNKALSTSELQALKAQRAAEIEAIQNQAYEKMQMLIGNMSRYGRRAAAGQAALDELTNLANRSLQVGETGLPMINIGQFLKSHGMFNMTHARNKLGTKWAGEMANIIEFMQQAPKEVIPLDKAIRAAQEYIKLGGNPAFDEAIEKGGKEVVRALGRRAWQAVTIERGVDYVNDQRTGSDG